MSIRTLFKIFVYSALALLLLAASSLAGAYFYFASNLPKVETLADYRPPIITQVFSEDGTVIGEYFRERRIVVPVERLPRQLIHAFIAAEDSKFFQHQGIDLLSIVRAAMKNVQAGGIVQGGSTITQQVAKSMLLSPERKFSRKFREAILAYRMEKALSKEEILHLYLNQIFLGHGAYGIQAAAENYFAKDVEELTLAECALVAGLPQAPSRYSPYRHYSRAKDRQRYVLGRMVDEGFITPEQAAEAEKEEIKIHPRVNWNLTESAYFTEQVRRYLEANYGEELLYTGGLQVHTSMNMEMQRAAQKAVRENLLEHDRRRGYRGPLQLLSAEEEEAFLADLDAEFGGVPPEAGRILKGVVVSGSDRELQVRIGSLSGSIPLDTAKWASPLRVVPRGNRAQGNAEGGQTRLPVGSVVLVRVEGSNERGLLLSLEQETETQGALVALDPRNGQVRAMVGGYDFRQSQFNRAIQARRQPGSAFKPLLYAAALDKGYTAASVILDTPVIYKERTADGTLREWKPTNYSDSFSGATSFRSALTHSNNVVTIKILEDIGVGYTLNYIRKLGIVSPMSRDLTLGLGSSAVTPLELATSYSVFANGGIRLTPTYIVKIKDRDGRVLESVDPGDFPRGPARDQRLIRQIPERVISAETAYLITNLMEGVIHEGTGRRARALERPAAGKTGTTNEMRDAWFAGYVPQLVAVSWVGYDVERPLGRGETGGRTALPAWLSFMQEAVKGMPPLPFAVPDDIEFRPIDPATGLLAPEDATGAVIEAFAPGNAPTRYAMDERRIDARDLFRLDMDDF
jgi:penicillin-binding protein 1A